MFLSSGKIGSHINLESEAWSNFVRLEFKLFLLNIGIKRGVFCPFFSVKATYKESSPCVR